jgi:hypothetical protein
VTAASQAAKGPTGRTVNPSRSPQDLR